MPRNISFALTTDQFLDGSKDVTRRMGWERLKVGDKLCAVKKAMGLRKGEQIQRLGLIEVTDVRRERLDCMTCVETYGREECRREGFPKYTPDEFIAMFCDSHKGCIPSHMVTRIEFKRIEIANGGGE